MVVPHYFLASKCTLSSSILAEKKITSSLKLFPLFFERTECNLASPKGFVRCFSVYAKDKSQTDT